MWITWKITMNPFLIDVSVIVNAKFTRSALFFHRDSMIEILEI